MLDILAQLGADQPELQPLLEAMRAQQFTHAEVVADEPEEGPTRAELLRQHAHLVALLKRARHEIKCLDATVRALQREAEVAGHFHTELAAALGACPVCWGTNRSCPSCRGRGGSGAYAADPPLYAHYVLPAVRRQGGPARPVAVVPAPATD